MVDIDMMCNGNLYHDFLKYAEDNNLFGNSQGMEYRCTYLSAYGKENQK